MSNQVEYFISADTIDTPTKGIASLQVAYSANGFTAAQMVMLLQIPSKSMNNLSDLFPDFPLSSLPSHHYRCHLSQ